MIPTLGDAGRQGKSASPLARRPRRVYVVRLMETRSTSKRRFAAALLTAGAMLVAAVAPAWAIQQAEKSDSIAQVSPQETIK